MPRFRYDVDQTRDPSAHQPELAGGTAAQHQLGNDHIVAGAYNDGYTQFWSQTASRSGPTSTSPRTGITAAVTAGSAPAGA